MDGNQKETTFMHELMRLFTTESPFTPLVLFAIIVLLMAITFLLSNQPLKQHHAVTLGQIMGSSLFVGCSSYILLRLGIAHKAAGQREHSLFETNPPHTIKSAPESSQGS